MQTNIVSRSASPSGRGLPFGHGICRAALRPRARQRHLRLAYLDRSAKPFTDTARRQCRRLRCRALRRKSPLASRRSSALPELVVHWVPVTMDTRFTVVMRGQARRVVHALRWPRSSDARRWHSRFRYSRVACAPWCAATRRPRCVTCWRPRPPSATLARLALDTLIEKTRFAGWREPRRNAGWPRKWRASSSTRPPCPSRITPAASNSCWNARSTCSWPNATWCCRIDDSARKNLLVSNASSRRIHWGLALPRDDDDFRLFVDSALSATYASPEFPALYGDYFRTFDEVSRHVLQLEHHSTPWARATNTRRFPNDFTQHQAHVPARAHRRRRAGHTDRRRARSARARDGNAGPQHRSRSRRRLGRRWPGRDHLGFGHPCAADRLDPRATTRTMRARVHSSSTCARATTRSRSSCWPSASKRPTFRSTSWAWWMNSSGRSRTPPRS